MTRTLSTLKLTLITVALSVLSLAVPTASAQNKAVVTVPFAFRANQQVLPAGQYQVVSSDSILMFIDANTGRTSAALLVRHEQGDKVESRGNLRFQVSGNRYYLVEARFSGSSTHAALLARPKLERSAKSTAPATSLIDIAMR